MALLLRHSCVCPLCPQEDGIQRVYCYGCCVNQERINVSVVPATPHVFFQPLRNSWGGNVCLPGVQQAEEAMWSATQSALWAGWEAAHWGSAIRLHNPYRDAPVLRVPASLMILLPRDKVVSDELSIACMLRWAPQPSLPGLFHFRGHHEES